MSELKSSAVTIALTLDWVLVRFGHVDLDQANAEGGTRVYPNIDTVLVLLGGDLQVSL